MNETDSAILNVQIDQARVDAFNADIERRTATLTARINAYRNADVIRVHPFVITVAENLVSLIGYSSDSTLDEWIAEIDPYVDPDFAEEYAATQYDNDKFSDPTSAEYRAFCTEVDQYNAVSKHLSDAERELLTIDILDLSDSCESSEQWDAALRAKFDAIMTFAENAA